jgi:hypothetical protein
MIAVALLGSLAAYVGSFYCLVQVQGPFAALGMTQIAASTVVVATVPASQAGGPVQSQLFGSNYSPQLQAQYRLVWQPAYRMGGNIASIVYAPIHAVDRMLRPDSWSITVPIVPLTPHPQNSFIWAGP